MEETDAIANSTRAISVNPFNVLEYKKRGTLNADIGKYKEAMEDYSKAIEIYPRDAGCFFNRGTVKLNLGDIEGAKEDFKTATILNLSVMDGNNQTWNRKDAALIHKNIRTSKSTRSFQVCILVGS